MTIISSNLIIVDNLIEKIIVAIIIICSELACPLPLGSPAAAKRLPASQVGAFGMLDV